MKKIGTRKAIITFVITLVAMLMATVICVSAAGQSAMRGDLNNDGKVSVEDALYLLRHTLMPSRYTIDQSGDVNGDGTVTVEDALYLLRHTLLPKVYPLACPHDDIVIDPEVRPTCTAAGLTEGTHCGLCGEVLLPQEELSATGHAFGEWNRIERNGCASVEYSMRICATCGYIEYDCEFSGDVHPHDFELTVKAATCTASGRATAVCKNCGLVGADEILSPLGHKLEWELTETTHCRVCAREGCGYKLTAEKHLADTDSPCVDAHCKVCGYFMREGIGHILADTYSSDDNCHWISCTRSGCNYVQSYGLHQCSTAICTDTVATCNICGHEFVPNGHHGMDEWYQTVAATCTTAGERRRDCVYCGYYETMTISATGHTMGAWYTVKAATETENGLKRRDCAVCDYYETRIIAATGHKLGSWYVTLEPTCTTAGAKRRDCIHCSYYETETIAPLGHYCTRWYSTNAATCTTAGSSYGYCTRCGAYMTRVDPALGHAWGSYITTSTHHWKHCARCGIRGSYGAHGGGRNTCTSAAKCSTCGYIYGQALGHNYSTIWSYGENTHYHACKNGCGIKADEGTHTLVAKYETVEVEDDGAQVKYIHKMYMECSTCGYKTTESSVFYSEHYGCTIMPAVEPTCTQSGRTWGLKCAVPGCNEVYLAQEVIPALGHNYVGGVCTRCGAKENGGGSGSGSGSGTTHTCVGMGWITTRQPTCTASGEKSLICSCGRIIKTATVPATGHIVVTDAGRAATCTTTGLTEGKHCYLCGVTLVEQKVIPLSDHAFGAWTQTKAPTCTEKGIEKRTCKNCTKYETRDIAALGHDYVNDVCTRCGGKKTHVHTYTETVIAPTCKTQGYTTHTCACGYSYVDSYVNATGHAYGAWTQTKAPTCTEKGEEKRTCANNCEHYETRDIPAKGHTYTSIVTAPTCKTQGYTIHTCACGFTYVDSYVNATGHAYGAWTQTKAPTCTEKGEEKRLCKNCEHYETRDIPAKGHTYTETVIAPTCKTQGYTTHTCACGYSYVDSYVDATGHAYGAWTQTKAPTCTEKGEEKRTCANNCEHYETRDIAATGQHTYVNGICKDCGKEQPPSSGLKFTLNSDSKSYSVTGIGTCTDTDIVIPATYNGKPVTRIGYQAFVGCSNLTSITIPNSVTSIGESTFAGCISLTSITIPNGVTSIGESTFAGCISLTSITIPNGVTSIGYLAFSDCTGLTSITIPNSVTSIGSRAFYNCRSLTSITIPNGVTSIGNRAFYNCRSLTSIKIPNSVTSIGGYAFSGCSNLESITLPFVGNKVHAPTDTYQYPFGYIFGEWSYTGGTATTQYYYHYYGSSTESRSTTYYIPTTLKSVTITGGSINYGAFYNCSGLMNITLGNNVTSIGNSAFDYCRSLTSITIGNSVTSIGNDVFYKCSSLTSITIGNSVTSIGNRAFSDCSSRTSITVDKKNTVYHSEGNCLIETASQTLIAGCKNSVIPTDGSVTSIGEYAFSDCSSLTSITIPNSVTSIGWSAFSYCRSLTSITIPNSVASIGGSAFYGCNSLTSITIPDSVTSIGNYAFSGCSSLTSITIPDSVTNIGNYAFDDCSGLESIAVDEGNAVYHSGGNCLIKTASKTLIAGCKNSVIPTDGSVTSIGDYAFRGCSSLTSITIPNSVTSIGEYTFYGCRRLTSITIPNSVTSIGNDAFSNTAYYNKSSNWKNGVLYIGDYLIEAETSISGSYIIKEGTKCIANFAFYNCTGLTSITIPNSVTSIGYWAFYGCSGLTSIKFTGTKSQWRQISKGSSWNSGTGNYTVYCTYGNISKSNS